VTLSKDRNAPLTTEDIRRIVLESLSRAPAEREEFLRHALGGDVTKLAAAAAMLGEIGAAATQAADPAEGTTIAPLAGLDLGAARIGLYTLVRVLGEGGFGTVYLAEQTEPHRRVALKVLRAGLESRQVIGRFEGERQALSLMDHPNIAKVLDAGETRDGRPYFAMEYVPGESITAYCDAHRLTITDRLMLFGQVCDAVQHAHTKGIIHRDLKPGNVLVTSVEGRPSAKVIDFGIAKATGGQLTAKGVFTEHRQLIGTPEYMSPEQAEGSADIDTRTDVYSLGVLLYELLIGVTPFDAERLRSAAYAEIHRIIREVDPPRPSTRLSTVDAASVAHHRGTRPDRLGTQIKGELDWIVMKCLEKDRNRRYGSPGALADDLARHLEGRPVVAAPPGVWYRARKFASRHTAAVTASAALLLALGSGLAFAVAARNEAMRGQRAEAAARTDAQRERHAAEEEAAKSRAALRFIESMFASLDPNTAKGRDVTVAEMLDPAVNQIADAFAGKPVPESMVRSVMGQAYFHLGQYPQAQRELERALELRRGAGVKDDAETWTLLHNLGAARIEQDQLDQAGESLDAALSGRRAGLGAEHRDTLATRGLLAYLRQLRGDLEGAVADFRGLAAVQERVLGRTDKDTIDSLLSVADGLEDLGQLDDALHVSRDAAERAETALGPESGAALTARSIEGETLSTLGRKDEAAAVFTRVVASKERVYGPDHPSTLVTLDMLASVLGSQMKDDESIALHRRVVERAVAGLGERHRATLSYMNNLAQALRHAGRLDEAEPIYRRVVELDREVKGPLDTSTLIGQSNFALLLNAKGNHEESLELLSGALAGFKQTLPEGHWIIGTAGVNLAEPLISLKRWEQAEGVLLESNSILEQALGSAHPRAGHCRAALVRVYEGWGKPDQAERWKQAPDENKKPPGPG